VAPLRRGGSFSGFVERRPIAGIVAPLCHNGPIGMLSVSFQRHRHPSVDGAAQPLALVGGYAYACDAPCTYTRDARECAPPVRNRRRFPYRARRNKTIEFSIVSGAGEEEWEGTGRGEGNRKWDSRDLREAATSEYPSRHARACALLLALPFADAGSLMRVSDSFDSYRSWLIYIANNWFVNASLISHRYFA